MKNFLKLSLLVMLLTGAFEMRAPEGEAPVVEGHVIEGAKSGEAPGEVMAIDGQATAAGKVAEHNAAMIKTMNSVIPGGVKIAAPMGGGISFGDDAAAKPDVASAPVSGKGGISLGLGKGSAVETHTADDGSKVVVHTDADGAITKTVITHKAPAYSIRSITDSIGLSVPKTTTIEHDPTSGTHTATTVDPGYIPGDRINGQTTTKVTFDAKTGQKKSTYTESKDYVTPTLTGVKTGGTNTLIVHNEDGSSSETVKSFSEVTSRGLIGSPRLLSGDETITKAAVSAAGEKTLLTTYNGSSNSVGLYSKSSLTTKETDHVNGNVKTMTQQGGKPPIAETFDKNGKHVETVVTHKDETTSELKPQEGGVFDGVVKDKSGNVIKRFVADSTGGGHTVDKDGNHVESVIVNNDGSITKVTSESDSISVFKTAANGKNLAYSSYDSSGKLITKRDYTTGIVTLGDGTRSQDNKSYIFSSNFSTTPLPSLSAGHEDLTLDQALMPKNLAAKVPSAAPQQ